MPVVPEIYGQKMHGNEHMFIIFVIE